MYPEYHELIGRLVINNPHFAELFDLHHALHRRIEDIESDDDLGGDEDVALLRTEQQKLEKALYRMLRQAVA